MFVAWFRMQGEGIVVVVVIFVSIKTLSFVAPPAVSARRSTCPCPANGIDTCSEVEIASAPQTCLTTFTASRASTVRTGTVSIVDLPSVCAMA